MHYDGLVGGYRLSGSVSSMILTRSLLKYDAFWVDRSDFEPTRHHSEMQVRNRCVPIPIDS